MAFCKMLDLQRQVNEGSAENCKHGSGWQPLFSEDITLGWIAHRTNALFVCRVNIEGFALALGSVGYTLKDIQSITSLVG